MSLLLNKIHEKIRDDEQKQRGRIMQSRKNCATQGSHLIGYL